MTSTHAPRPRSGCKLPIRSASAALLMFSVGLLAGCPQDTRDRLMHFFFEIPEAPVADTATSQPAAAAASPESAGGGLSPSLAGWVLHPPYQNGWCIKCHTAGAGMQFIKQDIAACHECHSHFYQSKRTPHMKDLVTQCRVCHHPHRSREPALLKIPQPDLCWECHDEDDVMEVEVHQQSSADKCTKCHEVHHSEREHMLRAEIAISPVVPLAEAASAERRGVEPHDFDDLRPAYFQELAARTGQTIAQLEAADDAISDSKFPFNPDDAEAIAAGARTFAVQCIRCHGPTLTGDGYIKYNKPNRISLLRENRKRGWDTKADAKAADYFATITDGSRVIGDHDMPTFREKLSRMQRWQLIAFVRSKQVAADQ